MKQSHRKQLLLLTKLYCFSASHLQCRSKQLCVSTHTEHFMKRLDWCAGEEAAGGGSPQLCDQGGGQGRHQDSEADPGCVMTCAASQLKARPGRLPSFNRASL